MTNDHDPGTHVADGSDRGLFPHPKPSAEIRLVVAVGSGAVLGVLSRLGDGLPAGLAGLSDIGGPWLVLAFALGALGHRPRRSAALGAASLACAAASYYGYVEFVQGGAAPVHLVSLALFWVMVGLGSGAVFGLAGRCWRWGSSWARVGAVSGLTGALVGESLLQATRTAPQIWLVVAELTAGLIAPWVLFRARELTTRAAAVGLAVATPAGIVVTAALSSVSLHLAN